jgi:hypothetical protein
MKIIVLALMIAVLPALAAQENTQPENDLIGYYENELFHWEGGPLGMMLLKYQDKTAVSVFDMPAVMRDALRQYPESSRQYDMYRQKNIAGSVVIWTGAAAVIGGLLMSAININEDQEVRDRNMNISLNVTLAGLVTELIGQFIIHGGSRKNLFNAVNIYNRNKINEYN